MFLLKFITTVWAAENFIRLLEFSKRSQFIGARIQMLVLSFSLDCWMQELTSGVLLSLNVLLWKLGLP